MFRWEKILGSALLALVCSLATADETAPALLSQGRVDEFISSLQSRISNTPNDAEAYNLLCRSYFSLGDWDHSISAGQKAAALEPNNSRYHLWLGRAYGEKANSANFLSAMGLAKKLRAEFETAVALDPADAYARTDLAEFYVEAPGIIGGGRDKAEAQAQALEKIDPPMAHWVRGRIAEKRKDLDKAENEYRAAIEASHSGAFAWFNLALFYRHQHRWDEMEKTVNQVAAAPLDRPEVLMESAEILYRSGRNFPGAIQLLRRYLSGKTVEEAPVFKAYYWLGTLLEQQGDKEGAAQQYRSALALARNFSLAQEALKRVTR